MDAIFVHVKRGVRCVDIDLMFESDPREEGYAESEVEEAFVGDCKDDEDWREC